MTDADLSAAVRAALRLRHPAPNARGNTRSVLLEEVRNATGFDATRSADALAFHFWPSDGLHITGYEIKASRADWIRELKDPEKSFAFARYCDFWWIAAATPKLVEVEELPTGWGLLVLNAKGRLHPVVAAKKLAPEPMPRGILMSIVRGACTSTWEPVVQAQVDELTARIRANVQAEARETKRALEDIKQRVREFEEASGVAIDAYDPPEKIGAVVRLVKDVLRPGYGGAIHTVQQHATALRALLNQCELALKELLELQQVNT